MWATPVARDYYTQLIPDFSGSALLSLPSLDAQGNTVGYVLDKFDPSARQVTNVYTFSDYWPGTVVPHPSGVLFVLDAAPACDPNMWPGHPVLNVVDGSTGALLGSASIEQNGGTGGGVYQSDIGPMIVAGDGNAYLPYFYTNYYASGDEFYYHRYWDVHLRVLRASRDGTSTKIDLGDWTGDCLENLSSGQRTSSGTTVFPVLPFSYAIPWWPVPSVITNADTGAAIFAVLYYADACGRGGSATQQTQVSFVAQDAITSQVNVASTSFAPTLQREDGSYIGTDGSGNVVALGQDGSVLWQQPIAGATPLYATADGGAIVTDTPQGGSGPLGTLYTLDQNGNVTSQTPDIGAIYSWTGEWYDPPLGGSTVSAVAWFDLNWGYGTGVFGGGNPSETGTWTDRCAALDSASNALIEKANTDLVNFLQSSSCPFCVNSVFTPLNALSLFPRPQNITQAAYASYLDKGHRFCDATKSQEPATMVGGPKNTTVAQYFASPSLKDTDAETVLPNQHYLYAEPPRTPLWTFFRPAGTTSTTISSTGPGHNKAMIFHEGLHGWGFIDGTLTPGICYLLPGGDVNLCVGGQTILFTDWIESNVFPAP